MASTFQRQSSLLFDWLVLWLSASPARAIHSMCRLKGPHTNTLWGPQDFCRNLGDPLGSLPRFKGLGSLPRNPEPAAPWPTCRKHRTLHLRAARILGYLLRSVGAMYRRSFRLRSRRLHNTPPNIANSGNNIHTFHGEASVNA